ncbi:hypothetical protein HPP92_002589 [Vanilla planifolia]|uniref:ACT domain-containing protein ACR n=1 Tax=Vanilla planifolia TaxID=51239 RepID=A0A835SEY8_VANPL|nr:hypothetical protein HPP92_002589 [Vanilla planifolia]
MAEVELHPSMEACCPYFDPDFENLNERIYGPRFSMDNEACENCTVIAVDSLDEQGLLLEVLQVLTDMDLLIKKSYISSDAGWFMDVFHVQDNLGNKIRDSRFISYIQQTINLRRGLKNSEVQSKNCHEGSSKPESFSELTAIEMIGSNRPGLFSEISAVLAEENCSVLEAHAWSHNDCLACVAYVSDESTASRIDDPDRLATIEDHLSTILQSNADHEHLHCGVKVHFIGCDSSMSRTERRLHQLMLANRDFNAAQCTPQRSPDALLSSVGMESSEAPRKIMVTIDHCSEKDYLIANIKSIDRPKLMFDIVCTLTDMQYVIFHAAIKSHGQFACQEYFIRHRDGFARKTVEERHQISKCLEAAIERRTCEGLRLELCAQNCAGLLPMSRGHFVSMGLQLLEQTLQPRGRRRRMCSMCRISLGKKSTWEVWRC